MLKFCCILLGENPAYVKTFQPAGKRKIVLLATCLLVPVIMWFITGYLLAWKILETDRANALLMGGVLAFIIFMIERAILMVHGGWLTYVFRVLVGIGIAGLGSICLDEVIFDHDIENQVASYQQLKIEDAVQKIENQYEDRIISQRQIVDQKASDWKLSLEDAKSEADGTGGSKQKKVGKIALLKLDIAHQLEEAYQEEQLKMDNLIARLEADRVAARGRVESEFNGNGLLIRIKAMFDLIASDIYMRGVYFLLTFILFCLEFLVVIIKMTSKLSIDEEMEIARDQLLRTNYQQVLEKTELIYYPEHLQMIGKARDLMLEKSTKVFN